MKPKPGRRTRYDKLARNFLAAAALVGAIYWIKLGHSRLPFVSGRY